MAKTIPQLTDATTVNAADELIIQQGGITKRATGAELAKGLNTINGTVNVKDFGAVGDGVADDTAAIQAAINYAETLVEQITTNYDIAKARVAIPAGRYKHTGLFLSQSIDGVSIVGDGAGVSVLEYAGASIGLKVGTETGSPNFSHVWISDISLRGGSPPFTSNNASIVVGSVGVQFNRMIRNCGMRNCQVFGHDINVQLRDCWTFKIRDNHIHNAKTHQVDWQTALNGELTGNRFDDCDGALVVVDGQGTSNQVKSFRMVGNAFQEAATKAVIFYDVSNAYIESNYFENNNQSDAGSHYDISFLQGTSARADGSVTLVNNYYSPGASTWTKTERAVYVESARFVQCVGEKTGSSAYNTYLEVGSQVQHAELVGCVFRNLSTSTAVTRSSNTTTLNESWARIDSSDAVVETVNRRTVGARSQPNALAMYHQVSTSSGSATTDANRTFFNLAGNNTTLTLNTADSVNGRALLVRKYSTSGDLTVETEGSELVSLNGSTNNTAVLSAARGAAWFLFDGTNWVCLPTDEAAGWSLSA
jgi:hypothetical protein